MRERICRDSDENIYQPKIHSERVRDLKRISLETGLPITVLVDYAIRGYVTAYQEEKRKREELQDEAAWNLESNYKQNQQEHEFDETDKWEDGSLYGI